jgi:hypothetical protein
MNLLLFSFLHSAVIQVIKLFYRNMRNPEFPFFVIIFMLIVKNVVFICKKTYIINPDNI